MPKITVGRYVPSSSWIHRLDPRLKIFALIVLMVAVFLPFNRLNGDGNVIKSYSMTFLMSGINLVLILILLTSAKTSFFAVLKSLRSLWFMLLFLVVVYILVPNTNPVLGLAWQIKGWKVYWDAFAEAGKILLRLMMMVMLTLILTASTKPLDLTYAFEWYLSPLKIFHFPSAEVAMTICIALRFIPTLLEDASRVMKAQSSRGVDFEHGHIWRRITGITSLIIPLFVSSFMRSEELANAMECRGYDPREKRTRYRQLKFHLGDLFAFLFLCAYLAGFLYLSITKTDLFALMGVIAL